MDIQPDMVVLDRDHEPFGTVEKVVFEPYESEVLGIIVATGLLHPRRVLSIEHVTGNEPLALKTDLSCGQFKSLDRFQEGNFRRPSGSWAPPNGWRRGDVRYPAPSRAYPVSLPAARPYPASRPAPPRTSPPSIDLDNDPVGSIEGQWEEGHDDRFEADPYDVLTAPVVRCCHAQYEWGEASMINPLPKSAEKPASGVTT